jgi:hypothetical protein
MLQNSRERSFKMTKIKGMVQVDGTTYRISRTKAGYEATRILDDCCAGTFQPGPPLEVAPKAVSVEVLRMIAITAVRCAKTSYLKLQAADGTPNSNRPRI